MAAQWATNARQRPTAFRTLTQLLADRNALKPGQSVAEATDIVFGLLSLEPYFITRCGWTADRWQHG